MYATICARVGREICSLTSPTASPVYAVIDASALIGLCAREPGKYPKVQIALQQYSASGVLLYAPHLIVMEALFVLCNKLQDGVLTSAEHATALSNLQAMMR